MWVRSPNKASNTPETAAYKKIDEVLPEVPGQSPEDRAKDIDSVMTWMRNHRVAPSQKAGETATADKRGLREKSKDVEAVFNWLRNPTAYDGDDGDEDVDDSVDGFRLVDQLLPLSEGQSLASRAQEIDNVITWLRNDGIDLGVGDAVEAFKKIAHLSMPDRRTACLLYTSPSPRDATLCRKASSG